MRILVLLSLLSACSSDTTTSGPSGSTNDGGTSTPKDASTTIDAAPVDPELPPTTSVAELNAWLAAAPYTKWKCEPAVHAGAANSPHGKVRICSNAKLSGSASGEYPVGAASVKELVPNGTLTGHAVAVKVAAGDTAQSWYWFEFDKGALISEGIGKSDCANCHASAATTGGRDYTFTQVK